jgi:hypothetical protein
MHLSCSSFGLSECHDIFTLMCMPYRAFQLLLTSALRFSHFRSQKVEATRRTTPHDDPKLAYEDKLYPAFSLYNGGLEAKIDLFRLTRLFHVVGNGLGVRNIFRKLGVYPQLWRVGGPVAPPGSAWRPNKLFLLVGMPRFIMQTSRL